MTAFLFYVIYRNKDLHSSVCTVNHMTLATTEWIRRRFGVVRMNPGVSGETDGSPRSCLVPIVSKYAH